MRGSLDPGFRVQVDEQRAIDIEHDGLLRHRHSAVPGRPVVPTDRTISARTEWAIGSINVAPPSMTIVTFPNKHGLKRGAGDADFLRRHRPPPLCVGPYQHTQAIPTPWCRPPNTTELLSCYLVDPPPCQQKCPPAGQLAPIIDRRRLWPDGNSRSWLFYVEHSEFVVRVVGDYAR